jgi:membrane-bound lytic murein transglycosylase D
MANAIYNLFCASLAVAAVVGDAGGRSTTRSNVALATRNTPPAPLSANASVPQPKDSAGAQSETVPDEEVWCDASETRPALESGEKGADPEGIQKEALELCQSAAELLRWGHRERAIRAADRAYRAMLLLPDDGNGASPPVKDDVRQLIVGVLREAYGRNVTPPPSHDSGVPMTVNEHVRREIKSLTTVEREMFIEAYRRSGRYRPMIVAKLEAARMPSQLSWLPLVESWFKVRAFSRAGAMGLWQFIASTGLRYGMTRDGWIDERMDPEKSTDAAIAYLTDLHGAFGDWPKALAAYNCGEGRVLRAQGRAGNQYLDFWDLYEQLPLETRRYIPRLIAALLIVQDPARYGMTLPKPASPPTNQATVKVGRPVSLAALEQGLGIPAGTLGELNPELRSGTTPGRDYELRIPGERVEAAPAMIAQLPESKVPRHSYLTHRVRHGETLRSIARQYGTTTAAIRRANGMRRAQMLRVGQRLSIAVRGS